jgi:hypothetical protein
LHHRSWIALHRQASNLGRCGGQKYGSVQDKQDVEMCKLWAADRPANRHEARSKRFARAERPMQSLELTLLFFGANFVTGLIFLPGGILSDRIYKICTPLSTGFVDKRPDHRRVPSRKPLQDVVFRGVTCFPQCRGR